MIMFDCPACKTKLRVGDEHAGKMIQCPKCKEKTIVPQSESAAAQAIADEPKAPPSPFPDDDVVTTSDQLKASKRSKAAREVEDEDDDDRPRRRKRADRDEGDAATKTAKGIGTGAIVAIILGLFACCGLTGVAVVVALLLPAMQKVQEAAKRTNSMNNLKQIGLAFHSFHDTQRRLPYNGVGPARGGDMTSGSWGFQILPFMEQLAVFQTTNRTVPVPQFMCPGRGRPMVETSNGGGAWSDYFYNNYLNDPLKASDPKAPDFKRTLVGISDGTSNTIFVGHGNINTTQYLQTGNVTLSTNIFMGGTTGTMRAGNNAGKGPGAPAPAGVTLMRDSATNPTIGSWGGPFPQGALMGMADGSVHTFTYATPNFSAFLTPTGGENVVPPF